MSCERLCVVNRSYKHKELPWAVYGFQVVLIQTAERVNLSVDNNRSHFTGAPARSFAPSLRIGGPISLFRLYFK